MRKGQTSLEYLILMVVSISIIATIWFFLSGTKESTLTGTTSEVYESVLNVRERGGSCGDNVRQTPNSDGLNELCDGLDLGSKTCLDFGYSGGSLGCSSDCESYDKGACSSPTTCGDGTRDPGEDCDNCPADSSCSGAALCYDDGSGYSCCTPDDFNTVCLATGKNCGDWDAGCGITRSCGTCTGFDSCNAAGICECIPTTCATSPYECGSGYDDGCGGTFDCPAGACSRGVNDVCVGGTCVCTPDTVAECATLGCGTHPDGCGGTVDCGACCTPLTCTTSPYECGSGYDDGCGSTFNCPDCSGAHDLCISGSCVTQPYCGDGTCNGGETWISCRGDCPWFPVGYWTADSNSGECAAGFAMTDYDCTGDCSGGKSQGYCRILPPGLSTGSRTTTSDAQIAYCPSGYIATGFDCTGDCGGGKMQFICRRLTGANLGSAWWTGDSSGSHSCSVYPATGFDCTGDCGGRGMNVLCRSFS